mmetsp:Transcript_41714/g.95726  ORF Transcript_41714/g.95726 Transcript_41714/m.95726 type:complete len:247 (+) Transcript_41714:105-845(+)
MGILTRLVVAATLALCNEQVRAGVEGISALSAERLTGKVDELDATQRFLSPKLEELDTPAKAVLLKAAGKGLRGSLQNASEDTPAVADGSEQALPHETRKQRQRKREELNARKVKPIGAGSLPASVKAQQIEKAAKRPLSVAQKKRRPEGTGANLKQNKALSGKDVAFAKGKVAAKGAGKAKRRAAPQVRRGGNNKADQLPAGLSKMGGFGKKGAKARKRGRGFAGGPRAQMHQAMHGLPRRRWEF